MTIREREREQSDIGSDRPPKRTKTEDSRAGSPGGVGCDSGSPAQVDSPLPPSHVLLGIQPSSSDGFVFRIEERDVGISEYVGRDVPKVDGIIKQRFTDFLVNEVNLDSQVVCVNSLTMPESVPKDKSKTTTISANVVPSGESMVVVIPENAAQSESSTVSAGPRNTQDKHPDATTSTNELVMPDAIYAGDGETTTESLSAEGPWSDYHNDSLRPYLSEDAIDQLRKMVLEGPEPPVVNDHGQSDRPDQPTEILDKDLVDPSSLGNQALTECGQPAGRIVADKGSGKRGKGRRRHARSRLEDERKVFSEPIASKDTRTVFHEMIRKLFHGKLESVTETSAPTGDLGSRIVIKWPTSGTGRASGHGGRSNREDGGGAVPRGTYPQYIHFTLQKTNRDTQDALGHLSRLLHVNIKDLSVAGTKDKRAVTVQRVSLKRGRKTVEDVWKLVHGQNGHRSSENALKQRGERGIRIADLNYRKSGLELGMLKGNAFLITLRNVQVESPQTLDLAMESLKRKGFINYYGMQRFGTASVPTHSIGLALLQSDWHKAVSLILQPRPGEHPEVVAAREAWLIHRDLDKALNLMPRRAVAERCILESYEKQGGETRNAMGALSTIPRNLRLMYVHAYQSYVWNAIVSERIRTYGSDKPIPGDLVFESETKVVLAGIDSVADPLDGDLLSLENEQDIDLSAKSSKQSRKSWDPPRVKALTADDVDKHTIFDVVMPLPGKDVAYPGGQLGERYKEFLRVDGLDPDNFVRKQKEYSLSGSYRKILHLPRDLAWHILRYTDPDVPLAQSDEDKLLGFEPPALVEDGKFTALQINITLGTAAYATMALREITKTETSSHFQSNLTLASEDQKFRAALSSEGAI